MKKIIYILILVMLTSGCASNYSENKNNEKEKTPNELLLNYKEALELLKEDTEAEVFDIETGISFNIKRVIGGYNTLADVETLSKEDTAKLLKIADGKWNIKRRAIILKVNDVDIAASISPFPHSGSEDAPYGEIIDNRSGFTGTGINLDSIRENNMIGVVDIYFHNSLVPGINRIDERHQEMVLKASNYEKQ